MENRYNYPKLQNMKKFVGLLLTGVVLIAGTALILSGINKEEKDQDYDKHFKPTEWFMKQRVYPHGDLNPEVYEEVRQRAIAQRTESARYKSGQEDWELVGPYNVGGRISDVEMHHTDTETIYVAAASGGIYKSPDKGVSWEQIFENPYTQSIGDMAIAKTDKNIIYVGTGEPNIGQGSLTYDGYGVFKSTDGGTSWYPSGLENAGGIGRVEVDPGNPNRVFVAASGNVFTTNPERGVYRSEDGGASWENVMFISDSTGCIDLCINPSNPDIIYAAFWERYRYHDRRAYGGPNSGIWKSTDGGDNWAELTSGLPTGPMGRIGIDISQSEPNVLYASYANTDGSFGDVYKTTDGGDNWTDLNSGISASMYSWWFSKVNIHPNDSRILWISDFNMYRSTNGGVSFERVSGLHVDQHGVYAHPAEEQFVVIGNDGGVYISENGTNTNDFVTKLPITQFYTCEVDFRYPERRYGGTQDNGTVRTMSGDGYDWHRIYGGDGFIARVDPTDSRFVYAASQRGGFGRSTNGGLSFTGAKPGGDRYNWKTPYILDPNTPSTLYLGSHRVYKSTNRAASWTRISNDLTNGEQAWNYGTITSIAASKINSDILIAGTDDGNVWITTNQGLNKEWTKVSNDLPVRWVTCVATDPFDENTAYVTFSGIRYHDYIPHVFKTTDLGQTWIDISSNLSDMPVNNMIIDPDNKGTIYLATDNGVFVSYNDGDAWETLGNGMPTVPVLDLNLHTPTRTLLAATFGRSMYKIPVKASAGVEVVENGETSMKLYPSPATEAVTIDIYMEEAQEGQVYIFDLSGRMIRSLHDGPLPKGESKITWDGGNASGERVAGVYICRLVSKGKVFTDKVQIQ